MRRTGYTVNTATGTTGVGPPAHVGFATAPRALRAGVARANRRVNYKHNLHAARVVRAQCALREHVGLPREILQLSENVCTQKRDISPKLQPLLQQLESVDDFTAKGTISTRTPDLRSLGLEHRFNLNASREGLEEFEREVAQLVYDFGQLAGVDHAPVTVCVTRNTTCSRLHVDNVGLRLLCTYRGPGTEWVASPLMSRIVSESVKNGGNSFSDAIKVSDQVYRAEHEEVDALVTALDRLHVKGLSHQHPDHQAANPLSAALWFVQGLVTAVAPIRRAEQGEVVILKGQAFPNSRGRAIVHRSPLVAADPGDNDQAFIRLLVKIDDGCC
eukprot:1038568-Pyramimonas_sp.AAC.1